MLFDNNNKILLTLIKKKKDQRSVIKKEKNKNSNTNFYNISEEEISRAMKRRKIDISSNMFAHWYTRGQENKLMKENERNETTLFLLDTNVI